VTIGKSIYNLQKINSSTIGTQQPLEDLELPSYSLYNGLQNW